MNGGGGSYRSIEACIVDEFVPHGSLDMPHIDHADWQVHNRRRRRMTTGTCAHGQETRRYRYCRRIALSAVTNEGVTGGEVAENGNFYAF